MFPTKGLIEIGETCIQGPALFKYFLAIRIPSFYLEVNLMPFGFLFTLKSSKIGWLVDKKVSKVTY